MKGGEEMVNKILVFLTVLGVLMAVSGFVVADGQQDVEVGVVADTGLSATPSPLQFLNLKPGQELVQGITLTAGTSPIDVSVGISGASFIQSMMADWEVDETFSPYNGNAFMMSSEQVMNFDTKVMVPVGTQSGTYTGTITYTVFEYIPPVCGNGALEAGEQCDDSNLVDFDGCSSLCMIETPVCGNTHVEAGEACDDGNIVDGDGCSALCVVEVCGDGITNNVNEECDAGLANGNACTPGYELSCNYCSETCTTITLPETGSCGDLTVQPEEVCDGNSEACTLEGEIPGTRACNTECTGFVEICTPVTP